MTSSQDLHEPRAMVVFESMFGNTEQVAGAVADGLQAEGVPTVVVEVATAPADLPPSVDLLVVGAPTHAFSLSRPKTRSEAVRQGADESKAAIGLREWLETVRPPTDRPVQGGRVRHARHQGASAAGGCGAKRHTHGQAPRVLAGRAAGRLPRRRPARATRSPARPSAQRPGAARLLPARAAPVTAASGRLRRVLGGEDRRVGAAGQVRASPASTRRSSSRSARPGSSARTTSMPDPSGRSGAS